MKQLTTILFILLTVGLFGQVTYYINADVVGGLGDGSSDANAFDEMTDITWGSGNTYRFKRGVTLTVTAKTSISSLSNIHIGAYGSGTDYAKIIDGRDPVTDYDGTFSILNCDNMLIDSLSGYGKVYSNTYGPDGVNIPSSFIQIAGHQDYTGRSQEITIRDCYIKRFFSGIRAINMTDINPSPFDYLEDLTITRCVIDSIYDDGIFVKRIAGASKTDTALVINYCTITNFSQEWQLDDTTGGDAIHVNSYFNGIYHVHNNYLDGSTKAGKFTYIFNSNNSAYAVPAGGQHIFEKNIVISGFDGGGTDESAQAVYYTIHTQNPPSDTVHSVFRYNTFIGGGDVNGIAFKTSDVSNNHPVWLYNNTFYGFYSAMNQHGLGQLYVYNNTFADISSTCVKYGGTPLVYNNIFMSDGTAIASTSYTHDKNWFTNTSDVTITANDFSGSVDFNDTSAFKANPWISGTTVRDYTVTATAGTVGTGKTIGFLTHDIDSVLYSSSYDIGANLYVGAVTNYSLTITNNITKGTVTGAGNYAAGATPTITCTPNLRYLFDGWIGADASELDDINSANTFVTSFPASNIVIEASYTDEPQYTLTITNNSTKGTVTGAGSYYELESPAITATANAGYTFDEWIGTDASEVNSTTSRITYITSFPSKNIVIEASYTTDVPPVPSPSNKIYLYKGKIVTKK